MYIYAHINKNTLRFVREQKAISCNLKAREKQLRNIEK